MEAMAVAPVFGLVTLKPMACPTATVISLVNMLKRVLGKTADLQARFDGLL